MNGSVASTPTKLFCNRSSGPLKDYLKATPGSFECMSNHDFRSSIHPFAVFKHRVQPNPPRLVVEAGVNSRNIFRALIDTDEVKMDKLRQSVRYPVDLVKPPSDLNLHDSQSFCRGECAHSETQFIHLSCRPKKLFY